MPDGGSPFLTIQSDRMAEVIARCEAGGARHYVPLLQAVAARLVIAVFVERTATPEAVSISALASHPLPKVVLIQDDDHATTGPAGFATARKILRWVRGVIVHGTGAHPEHYAAAVAGALVAGSCALIETSSVMAPAWRDTALRAALPRKQGVVMLVPKEGAHPDAPVQH